MLCPSANKNAQKPLASSASYYFICVKVTQGEKTRPYLLLGAHQKQQLAFC